MPEEPKSPPPSSAPPPPQPQLDDTLDAKPWEPPKKQTCGLAHTALVCSLIGVFNMVVGFAVAVVAESGYAVLPLLLGLACGPIAVVVGIMAMVKIGRSDGLLRGMGQASAGVTVGAVLTLAPLSLLPAMLPVHENPQRAACKNNLRQLGIALHAYADDNGDRFPPDLSSLYPDRVRKPQSLFCPRGSGDWRKIPGTNRIEITRPSYVYVSGLRASDPGSSVLAFDHLDNHDRKGRCVVCIDCSVLWIKAPEPGKPDALKEMLDQTREAVKQRGGEIRLVGE
jgi:hypothetical protein